MNITNPNYRPQYENHQDEWRQESKEAIYNRKESLKQIYKPNDPRYVAPEKTEGEKAS